MRQRGEAPASTPPGPAAGGSSPRKKGGLLDRLFSPAAAALNDRPTGVAAVALKSASFVDRFEGARIYISEIPANGEGAGSRRGGFFVLLLYR
jgi:hypothetical protein